MRRLLLQFIAVISLAFVLAAGILIVRLVLWQDEVSAHFTVRDNARVIVVGNSHAGCTWDDSPELGLQVFWHSATAFPFGLFRIKEIIRNGGFKNASVLLVPCDSSDFALTDAWHKERNYAMQFPFAWRYYKELRGVSAVNILKRLFVPISSTWEITEDPPLVDTIVDKEKLLADYALKKKKPFVIDEAVAGEMLDTLSEIKKLCDENHIRLVLYASPMPPVGTLDANITEWIGRLKGLGYDYRDYRQACPDFKMFFDSNHLNKTGRRLFTEAHINDCL